MFGNGVVVNNRAPNSRDMSSEAYESVRRGIICGITSSLANYLFNNCADANEASKKMLTFVNALRAGKEINEEEADWQFDVYFNRLRSAAYPVDPDCAVAPCTTSYLSWYTVVASLIDDQSVFAWSFTEQSLEKMTERERELVMTLRKATEAYNKARSEFEAYFREVNKKMLCNELINYGTVLSQIAPKWYKSVCEAAGISETGRSENSALHDAQA